MTDKKFNPEEFLGAKVVSPLEQEKLVGGIASAADSITITVETVVKIVAVTVTP